MKTNKGFAGKSVLLANLAIFAMLIFFLAKPVAASGVELTFAEVVPLLVISVVLLGYFSMNLLKPGISPRIGLVLLAVSAIGILSVAYAEPQSVDINFIDDNGINCHDAVGILQWTAEITNNGPGDIFIEKAAFFSPVAGCSATTEHAAEGFTMTGQVDYPEGATGQTIFSYDTSFYTCGRVQVDAAYRNADGSGDGAVFLGEMINYGVDCQPGSISGIKFEDANGNGARDSGEQTLSGWTIYLDSNDNSALDGGEPNTVTDGSGAFSFSGLQPGIYHVREQLQSGWTQTTPNPAIVTLSYNENENVEIGNMQPVDQTPIGFLDGASCPIIGGWAVDMDTPSASIMVHIYADGPAGSGTFVAAVLADGYRPDVNAALGITGNHGFTLLTPTNLKDSGTHSIYAYGINSNPSGQHVMLSASPKTLGPCLGSISGVKFNDANGNALQDGGEEALAGWTIYLDLNDNGILDSEPSTTTGGSGTYSFSSLEPGNYRVREVQQSGWTQTTSDTTVTVTAGQTATANFGNRQMILPTNSISGLKFKDVNGNGERNGDDVGLEGWTITISGMTDASTQTDSSGFYEFTGLADGDYTVCETLQSGWTQTFPASGASCPDGNGYALSITGSSSTGNNFGNRELPGSISGVKFKDLDGDGIRDSGEQGMFGWTIFLDANQNGALDSGETSTETGADGNYSFTVNSGTYHVREQQQNGWTQTTENQTVILVAGQSQTVDFGNMPVPQPFCGDSSVDTGEECDLGPANGQACTPSYGGTCSYCSAVCSNITLEGPNCGDNVINGNEQCDNGPQNGQACTPSYGGSCNYCSSSCTPVTLTGPYCGDSIVNGNESCDNGSQNGQTCTPSYGGSCNYCSSSCAPVTLQGPRCGDGAVDSGEQCDDGNSNNGDGCSSSCANELGSISGFKFNDSNSNGVQDGGEGTLGGWTIYLDANNNGVLDSGETSATTDLYGIYLFGSLDPGTYHVREVQQAGWIQTTANPAPISITYGSGVGGVNFGNRVVINPGTISGMKFNDTNGNGASDVDEVRISGWTIFLDTNDNGVLDSSEASTTTDASGFYSFSLAPGTYIVREQQQSGWTQTTSNPEAVTITSGVNASGIDFGNQQTPAPPNSLSGIKFNDTNGNAIFDGGEAGLAGWTVAITGPVTQSAVTDVDGFYEITGLPDGAYFICEVQQSGWSQTYPGSGISCAGGFGYAVNLSGGVSSINNNFGNQKVAPLNSISGIKFNDANGNGLQDSGESGLAGWMITLENAETSQTTATDEDGFYEFTGLNDGLYTICEIQQSGWSQTYPMFGATCPEGKGHSVSISGSGSSVNNNFGNRQAAEGLITGVKFKDLNGNSLREAGEPGMYGWRIYLDQNQNGIYDVGEVESISGANGNFSFTLSPGTYYVREVQQSGWTQTTPNPAPIVLSGQTIDVLFGNSPTMSSISGIKFNDMNGNGLQDSGENGIANWTIYLDSNNNGVLDSGEPTSVTSCGGMYSFTGLSPGTYYPREVQQQNWVQTTTPSTIELFIGQSATANFGNRIFTC